MARMTTMAERKTFIGSMDALDLWKRGYRRRDGAGIRLGDDDVLFRRGDEVSAGVEAE